MGGANSMGQHECALPDCHTQVSPSRMMCAYHWFKVPAELRRDVLERWNLWSRFHGETNWQEYIHARELAVEAVEELKRRQGQS